MRIPEELIEQIRQEVNIVDVISDHVLLEKRGRNHFACCPFHEEASPSFSVSEDKQIYYCFGCHESGNVYSFLMKYLGLNFQEAVIQVASYANIDVSTYEASSHAKSDQAQHYKVYYELVQFVNDFYHYVIMTDKGKEARKYLHARGISDEDIKNYYIGFAPSEHVLAELLVEKGYKLDVAVELNLIRQGQDLTSYYDTFMGRIVFPIKDTAGNVVAFTGRLLQQREGQPKYYHSSESIIFKKRELFYHFSDAFVDIRKNKSLYICEGIFDVIAMNKAGLPHAVASLGTAITQEQLNLLRKHHLAVNFVFDNDGAGRKALAKAVDLAIQNKIRSYAVTFWEYEAKDIDELYQQYGAAKTKQLLVKSIEAIDYLLIYYETQFDLNNNEDRQSFARAVYKTLAYTNQATQEFYYDKIKQLTRYSDAAMQQLFQSKRVPASVNNHPPQHVIPFLPKKGMAKTRQQRCEELIIKSLCFHTECIQIFQRSPLLTQNLVFRELIYEILEQFRKYGRVDASGLFQHLSDDAKELLTSSLFREEPVDEQIFAELLEALKEVAEEQFFIEALDRPMDSREQKQRMLQQLIENKRKKMY